MLLIKGFGKIWGKKCRKKPKFFRNFSGGTFSDIFGEFSGNFPVSYSENGANFPEFFAKKSENWQKYKKNVKKNAVSALRVR